MKIKLQNFIYRVLGALYMIGCPPIKWNWGVKPEVYLIKLLYAFTLRAWLYGFCSRIAKMQTNKFINNQDAKLLDEWLSARDPRKNNRYKDFGNTELWGYFWEPIKGKNSYGRIIRLKFLKHVLKNEY